MDIFLPNAAEAARITSLASTEAAARRLALTCDIVAVKAGEAGGLACRGDEVVRAASLPLEAADATGAGDNFDAGFLAGRLSGLGVGDSLSLAVACGGLSTQSVGGTGEIITLEQALAAAGLDCRGRPDGTGTCDSGTSSRAQAGPQGTARHEGADGPVTIAAGRQLHLPRLQRLGGHGESRNVACRSDAQVTVKPRGVLRDCAVLTSPRLAQPGDEKKHEKDHEQVHL